MTSDARKRRGSAGRALIVSALVMLALGLLFAVGAFPLEASVRPIVLVLFALVAIADAAIGLWFIRRSR